MKRIHRSFVVAALLVVAVLLLVPAIALADDGGGKFSIFSGITVRADETIEGDVGSIFGGVTVLGRVNGDVFSVFGAISLSGQAQVSGDVVSVFGGIALSGNAAVGGDVATVFSTIDASPTAKIGGTRTEGGREFEGLRWPRGTRPEWTWRWDERNWAGDVVGGVLSSLLLAAVAVVTYVLFPRRVKVVRDTMVYNPWSSLGVGFLGLILVPPLALLLALTCIGAILVLLVAFFGTLLGLVAISLWIGQRTMVATSNESASPLMTVLAGSLILGLVMAALSLVPCLGCFSGPIWFLIWSLGFGAVLLSRAGSVPPGPAMAVAYAPVPAPPVAPAPPEAPSAPAEPEPQAPPPAE